MTASSEPPFLASEEVRLLHSLAILEHGGHSGVRDEQILESALAQPRVMFSGRFLHERPFAMAAGYAFHLCLNHPFVDGNKRVAWAAMRAFLLREGLTLRVEVNDAVDVMLQLAAGQLTKEELVDWIAAHSSPQ